MGGKTVAFKVPIKRASGSREYMRSSVKSSRVETVMWGEIHFVSTGCDKFEEFMWSSIESSSFEMLNPDESTAMVSIIACNLLMSNATVEFVCYSRCFHLIIF